MIHDSNFILFLCFEIPTLTVLCITIFYLHNEIKNFIKEKNKTDYESQLENDGCL